VITVKHLFKSFGSNKVLADFNIEVMKGENVVVLGKSGSGKSVLIKCMIGLLDPDSGTITVLGENINELNEKDLDELRSRIGFLFQSNALYDSMTVRENLRFPLRRHKLNISNAQEEEMIMDALEDVGLVHTIEMMPAELSGGMRKRIALARTLILKPEIILYDEPTTGLDPITAKEIINLIIKIRNKYGTSAIIISHDMNCVRMAADRIAVLAEGRCYAIGTYSELLENKQKEVKQFFE